MLFLFPLQPLFNFVRFHPGLVVDSSTSETQGDKLVTLYITLPTVWPCKYCMKWAVLWPCKYCMKWAVLWPCKYCMKWAVLWPCKYCMK